MTERRFRRRMERLPRSVRRLVRIGESPSDSEELRVRKAVLVLSTVLMAGLALVWVATYASLGLWVSAAIPFVYQVASAASLWSFSRTRRFALFRDSQLLMSLLLPFALQWSLGGFENASAVCLWAFTSPLGALLIAGARGERPWFVGVRRARRGLGRDRLHPRRRRARDPAAASSSRSSRSTSSAWRRRRIALLLYFVARERAQASSSSSTPSPSACCSTCCRRRRARASRSSEGIIADDFDEVTVLFADIVGFTPLVASGSPPPEVVVAARPAVRGLRRARRPRTASRRSRRSATPTWSPAASRCRAPITPRRSPSSRSRWDRASRACAGETGVAARGPDRHRHRPGRRRRDRPARSSSTTCGATP